MSTTAALTAFADALATLGIDPSAFTRTIRGVAVSLGLKTLDKQLAKEHADGFFEGVGVTGEIVVKGVRYVVSFG
jgi:hypothetical protein